MRTYTVRHYSCPKCQAHVVSHVVGKLHVEPVLRQCRKCEHEIFIPTAKEWEMLTPDERGFHQTQAVSLGCYLLLIGLVLSVVGAFTVSSLLGDKENVGYLAGGLAVSFCLTVIAPLTYLTRQARRKVTASKQRMADPDYRERVRAHCSWELPPVSAAT